MKLYNFVQKRRFMQTFQPVLLGSDANVYGMARSFYAQYVVVSDAICKAVLVD